MSIGKFVSKEVVFVNYFSLKTSTHTDIADFQTICFNFCMQYCNNRNKQLMQQSHVTNSITSNPKLYTNKIHYSTLYTILLTIIITLQVHKSNTVLRSFNLIACICTITMSMKLPVGICRNLMIRQINCSCIQVNPATKLLHITDNY